VNESRGKVHALQFVPGTHRRDGDAGSFPWGWSWRRIFILFGITGLLIGFVIGYGIGLARLLR
jgi:hypothetical protein